MTDSLRTKPAVAHTLPCPWRKTPHRDNYSLSTCHIEIAHRHLPTILPPRFPLPSPSHLPPTLPTPLVPLPILFFNVHKPCHLSRLSLSKSDKRERSQGGWGNQARKTGRRHDRAGLDPIRSRGSAGLRGDTIWSGLKRF